MSEADLNDKPTPEIGKYSNISWRDGTPPTVIDEYSYIRLGGTHSKPKNRVRSISLWGMDGTSTIVKTARCSIVKIC